jgi:hypothetical protein
MENKRRKVGLDERSRMGWSRSRTDMICQSWVTYFGGKKARNLLQWALGSPAGLKIKLLS